MCADAESCPLKAKVRSSFPSFSSPGWLQWGLDGGDWSTLSGHQMKLPVEDGRTSSQGDPCSLLNQEAAALNSLPRLFREKEVNVCLLESLFGENTC